MKPSKPPSSPRKIKIGQKVILFDENGKFLIVRKSETHVHLAGQWELVGGLVKIGEDLTESVQREVREESGLEIEPTIIDSLSLVYPKTYLVLIAYMATTADTDITLSFEHDDHRWITLAELPSYKTHSSTERFIEKACALHQATKS